MPSNGARTARFESLAGQMGSVGGPVTKTPSLPSRPRSSVSKREQEGALGGSWKAIGEAA